MREICTEFRSKFDAGVLVSQMVGPGTEMFLGVKRDPQFGPVVLMGFGGTSAEALGDVVFAIPPFDAEHARQCFDRLRLRPLLDGLRGQPRVNVDALCETAAVFSVMVDELRDVISELDVNPLIAIGDTAIAVDALVVGRDRREDRADT